MTYMTRMKTLGLTAYGDNELEAREKLERMFATWIHFHITRNTGKVTERILIPLGAECSEYEMKVDKD